MGWDVSGIVEQTGSAVTKFKPGDAVYSRPDIARNGAYAEFVAVREARDRLQARHHLPCRGRKPPPRLDHRLGVALHHRGPSKQADAC